MADRVTPLARAAALDNLQPDVVVVYTVNWASEREKQNIIESNDREGRQTMNLRNMPDAKLLVLKDTEGKVIGWTGFDVAHNPTYPEMFSLYLDSSYSEVPDLGLALSHIKYSYLLTLGIKQAFGRVQANVNNDRLQFRVNLGINEIIDAADHQDWVSMCKKCSLYGVTCTKQAYFKVNLERLTRMAKLKLGQAAVVTIPARLELKLNKKQEKSLIGTGKYHVRWAA